MSDHQRRAAWLIRRFNQRRNQFVDELRGLVSNEPPAVQDRILTEWLNEGGIKLPSTGKRGPKSIQQERAARKWAQTSLGPKPSDETARRRQLAKEYHLDPRSIDRGIADHGSKFQAEMLQPKLERRLNGADRRGNPLNRFFVGPRGPPKTKT